MKRLYVFADFDWLKAPRLIGELSYESLRGSDSYGFCYSDDWLRDYGNFPHFLFPPLHGRFYQLALESCFP